MHFLQDPVEIIIPQKLRVNEYCKKHTATMNIKSTQNIDKYFMENISRFRTNLNSFIIKQIKKNRNQKQLCLCWKQICHTHTHPSLVAYGTKLVFVGGLWTIWVFGLKRWRKGPGMQIKLLPFFSSVPVAAILDFKMAAIFNIFWPTSQLLSYLESSKWWLNFSLWC